ncbi:methylenetetrahydrofolate reductase [NAD(P)H] [Cognatishimia sp. SS12]|uniref:methylenetetrahydrofolate reductase [NAD(P)H] n=1 Tax=Cognatishimia sp. SS12 TaxID=2979465 RepID=UPI00232F283A|nr:methylenetetrahydrofolate reductase [NAD(P)H] [Cognatishimia sp. SS12]MDC0736843.1 methylenetetrahydrofolate reductase [NAD(P)H] [Cognatishimia sp. SS12]
MTAPRISLEFLPPKNLEGAFRLWDSVQALSPLEPRFVSVTYGAGGSTRELTRDTVATLHKASGLKVAAHLTCVGSTRAETLEIAKEFFDAGVKDIVALRGDPPKGTGAFQAHPNGFASSVDLIEALADSGQFTIRVGAYPEKHPEAKDADADVRWLKAKMDAGASEALTQFFFEPEVFLRFRDRCEKAGITAPVIPGILPIENWKGARNFAKRCGASIPGWMEEAFARAALDGSQEKLATELCIDLCNKLMAEGVDVLHFYPLNKAKLTLDVCRALGVPAGKPALNSVA